VGYTFEVGQKKPVVWTYTNCTNVVQASLDKFSHDHGIALAINDSGQIVGSVFTSQFPFGGYDERACFWRVSGGGGVLDDDTFNMDLIRAYKVGPSSGSSKVAGVLV
jgi:hypothetical protein